MKPASARFLRQRPDCRVVEVARLQVAWAAPNACVGNSALLQAMDPEVWSVQAGWMVGDDFGELGTVFVPHYWVVDTRTGQAADPTPRAAGDHQAYDYLLDPEMLRYASRDHPLPAPFWLDAQGDFVVMVHGGRFERLMALSTAYLYTLPSPGAVRAALQAPHPGEDGSR
ncbi:MAG: hypothetical protein FGM55_03850 [Rhodoferax sp.]|nr:hypothetical protein [Rhodoferax sp.]